ncbi:ABC transporter ATP-binding protein [Planctomycetota bacterium]|nr:ABC transporter ATP-binding protein [Planctomycetota bacterium]
MAGSRGLVELSAIGVDLGTGIRATRALDDVSLDIVPGEFVALLGPSGCGKTTLLNVIAGFIKPGSGSVRIDRKLVTGPSARCPVVFQHHSLFPWMTAAGNVAFGPEMLGLPDPAAIAREYLGLVGLAGQGTKYPGQLSGGQRQRVGLARALSIRPDVLLLDEPFGALDAMTRELMQELLLTLWERDRHTTVFVTHDLEEAIFLADRVAVMAGQPGRIRAWIEVRLPRPRTPDQRHGAVFQNILAEVSGLVREESLRVFQEV